PQGCAFHPRCPYAQVQCRTGAPPPTRQIADRAYACVLNLAGDETVFPLTGGSFDEAQAD
ncbi:ABC transporter ATP-binding protein, partial [Klebsiella michiganensis]